MFETGMMNCYFRALPPKVKGGMLEFSFSKWRKQSIKSSADVFETTLNIFKVILGSSNGKESP